MRPTAGFQLKSLAICFAIIAIAEVFFLLDVTADIFGIDMTVGLIRHDVLELISALALAVALIAIGWQIRNLLKAHRAAETSLRAASGELLAVIDAKFDAWALSPSEREIALLLIKGLTVQEIATIRDTRDGTVKSQASMIYQKAGIKNRSELAAYFVEDLLSGPV